MAECLTREEVFGNPGSTSHDYGEAASELAEAARAQVAAAVGAEPGEVIWTSGATEANNLAIFGTAHYYRDAGRHIVTVRTEHKAVLDPCRELERRGWRVTYLTPDRHGMLDPGQVAAALRPDTVLVSIMHVNNETGVIQDIAAIASLCAQAGGARLHVDAAQSVGKCAVNFAALGIDLMSLSAHKAYGPKGVGALLVSRRRGVQLEPLQFGGGQERGLRSGTLATHQVVGMGAAFALASAAMQERPSASRGCKIACGTAWRAGRRAAQRRARSVPHLLNVSFEDVEGESLLAAIRPHLAVSTGSACTSVSRSPPMSCARWAATIVWPRAACASALAAFERGRHRHGDCGGRRRRGAAAQDRWLVNYSDLTRSYFEAPRARGCWPRGRLAGRSRQPGTGHLGAIRRAGRPNSRDGAVQAARFLAFGCPHMIAVAAWLAEHAVGQAARAHLPDGVQSLRERFGVPMEKLGRLFIVEDAWIAAWRGFRSAPGRAKKLGRKLSSRSVRGTDGHVMYVTVGEDCDRRLWRYR